MKCGCYIGLHFYRENKNDRFYYKNGKVLAYSGNARRKCRYCDKRQHLGSPCCNWVNGNGPLGDW